MNAQQEHAVERQESYWNRETLTGDPPPGSAREAVALDRIDFNRDQERVAQADTDPGKRRARQRRYYRARGLHVEV